MPASRAPPSAALMPRAIEIIVGGGMFFLHREVTKEVPINTNSIIMCSGVQSGQIIVPLLQIGLVTEIVSRFYLDAAE